MVIRQASLNKGPTLLQIDTPKKAWFRHYYKPKQRLHTSLQDIVESILIISNLYEVIVMLWVSSLLLDVRAAIVVFS